MKLFKSRITALYAAPAPIRPGDPDEKTAENDNEYPRNYGSPDRDRGPKTDEILDVYAGPMPYGIDEEPEEPEEVEEAEPEKPEEAEPEKPEAPFMPPQPPMMMVYAGPDYFANKNSSTGGFAPIPGMARDEGEKKEEEKPEEAPETDEERMQRLIEEYKKNPPAICGIVQATHIEPNTSFLNMDLPRMNMPATPNYCPHCGTKTVKGDRFCRECGESLV